MNIKFEGGMKFSINQRNHAIISDQPANNGGTDQGMTPPELLVASLGSCIGVYVVSYCTEVAKIDTSGLEIELDYKKAEDKPSRIGTINVSINLPAKISEERKKAILRSASHCLVHNTLTNPPKITIEYNHES